MESINDDLIFPLDTSRLNRYFIQLISCGDDYQFQELIQNFLPLLIRSIEVQNEDFRKKALEVFIHMNKRLKSRPEIQIPVRDLLEIFITSSQCSPFSSNFSIMYIKMGFMRLKSSEQVDLIPNLFQTLSNRTQSHQELLMGLIVYALQYVKIIPNINENIVKYGLTDQPTIRHLFLNFLLNVLLLPYKFDETKVRNTSTRSYVEPSAAPVDEILFSTMDDAPSKEPEVFKQPYPCLNEQLYNRIIEAIQTDELNQVEKLKVAILKFLNGNIYSENEIVFHFVLSTADSRYSVVLAAEHDIKRLTVAVDWNSMIHVQNLFEFFLGTAKTIKQTNEQSIRNPSNTRIRIKLYPYLLKSRLASTIFPHAIQILYESLFGNSTNARIKHFSLQFAQNIIQNAEIANLTGVSKLILQALEKILNTETSQTHDGSRLRSITYVLIGKLSYRIPKLFADDIRLTQKFFEALKHEDNECCLNIQEALNLLAYSQKDASISSKLMLQHLLTQQVIPSSTTTDIDQHDYPNCRQAAVSFVMNVFPSNDCTSRFILLIACSDKNEDIRSLASRNLFTEQEIDYPEFNSLLKLILSNVNIDYSISRQTLIYHPQTYQQMIYYLHRCLIRQSFAGEKLTPLWKYEDQLKNLSISIEFDRNQWYNYIQFLLDFVLIVHDCLSTYFLFESILIGYYLNDFKIMNFISTNLSSFRQLCLFSTRDNTRIYASYLYAYILSKIDSNSQSIDELIKILSNSNQRFEQREGSIIALGYICSYLNETNSYKNLGKDLLLKLFFDNSTEYNYALLISIGQLARMNCFDELNQKQIENLIDILKIKIRTINETNRLKEKAIQTLGFLSICYRNKSQLIIEILTQTLVDTKQIELHLNIGDALVCCILGVETPLVNDPYLILDKNPLKTSQDSFDDRGQLIEYLFDRILNYSSDINNPHTRQVSFLWLLTFLIHCRRPYLNKIYRILFENKIFSLEKNLIFGLIDQDEFNQELSSKCLIYIYEILDNEQLQMKFNQYLFEYFTDSTRSFSSQQTTIIYELTNQQQQTNIDNTQMILYKEFCSLIDLLSIDQNIKSRVFYSFLYLAHENSIWSTTRYGQILHLYDYEQKSIELILIYIDKFISRLFRLLYDPQIRIQECFKRIWKKLFSQTKQIIIIEKYFHEIFMDFYQDMQSSRWRIRESIQSALFDLFRMINRKLIDNQQYLNLFQELFKRLLNICDDTKESVRKIALNTINAFKQNCILLACDPATTISNSISELEHKQRGRYVLEQILPVILNEGLYHKNEDIAKFSLNTILEIIRYGDRETLKPYCTLIIIALFEALSSIEPDVFNYSSMKLTAAELKEQIDIARLLCARSSPIMDAIQTCTNQFVDETILDDLSMKLIDTLKHSIGLTTKCLIGQYFMTLTNLFSLICSKYVGKWMAVLVNTMSNNSNRTLRKTYTNVLGTIVRLAKHSSIENLLQKLTNWFYQTDNDYQYVCALTLNSISQSNHDLLIEFGQQCLPLIFLAMQEISLKQKFDDDLQEEIIWKNLWMENTGSSINGIQLYMNGIREQIRLAIEHSSYTMKIKGAKAIEMIANVLKGNLKQQDLEFLVEFVLKGLYGRVYDGKENFLRAIESLCMHCKDLLQNNHNLVQRIYENILKECKKESLAYRSIAIRVLSLLADEFNYSVYELFWIWFEKALKQPDPNEEQNDKLDVDEDPILSDVYHRTLVECLARIWPKTLELENQYKKPTFDLLIEILFHSNWQMQLLVIQSINSILKKSSNLSSIDIEQLVEPILNLGPRTKSIALKREILRFVLILFENLIYGNIFNEKQHLKDILQFNIEEMIHENRSNEISEQAKQLKKNHEHFFVKTKTNFDEQPSNQNIDSNDFILT